ncbi:M56 family metallopeptidase [Aquirufa antheringensis]|uniref:M56 family metallopeptidase n=1 Tax=Aquirufa antheringensis TaxID=2516559 RepID=UPI0022A90E53|nr:M56 family metallopeptidase [Aquirufa antheringensis]MCZ2489810.1 TonB-dependent receptor plug domain-containing protein [Aquirufa antheringensis]
MNDTFIYLLKSMIYAGIFFGYYTLFLKNTIYHAYNRFYLLAAMALSVVFPMFHLSISVFEEEVAATPALKYLMYGSTAPVQGLRVTSANIPSELVPMYVISALLLGYLAYSILKVFRLKAVSAKKQMGDFTFIETDLEEAPFSFFSNLFWKKSISMEDESGRKILQHELAHIREKHSWDRLFSQLICSIFWMNPFNWIMQKELQNIHEFIADRDAVGTGEVDAFAKMLLQTYYGNHFLNPSHSFYYSSIKRRIIMLTTSKTPKYAYLRKVAVLPLVAISLVLFSIQLSAQKPKPKKELATQYTVTMRPDSTTFSDPKTGKKVFSVATRDMPPPPPPAGAPAPPTPPVLTLHGSGSDVKLIYLDSTTVEFKGQSGGKEIVFRAEKVNNNDLGSGKKSNVILSPSASTSPKVKPLIVIDGVITSEINLNDLNPNNIQSMNVLKGEKATTKYAEKGANGVIEITTKKP